MTTDSYFTPARRADRMAMKHEPYRGHRIVEIMVYAANDHSYQIESHEMRNFNTPAFARIEIDDCVDGGHDYGCDVEPEEDIFKRFER